MDHADHVSLLRDGVTIAGAGAAEVGVGGDGEAGVPAPGGAVPGQRRRWADIGSGEGAFTLALADLLGPGAEIFSLDRDERALAEQGRTMAARFPETILHQRVRDFRMPLDLPPLDGIVMANSLHFVAEKASVLGRLRGCLRPGGRFVLVEYDTHRGNPWVPHPLAYGSWERLAKGVGFVGTRPLATVPSRFLGRIYSALSLNPWDGTADQGTADQGTAAQGAAAQGAAAPRAADGTLGPDAPA